MGECREGGDLAEIFGDRDEARPVRGLMGRADGFGFGDE